MRWLGLKECNMQFSGYEKIIVLLPRKRSKSGLSYFKQNHVRILLPSDFKKEDIFKQTLQLEISFYSIELVCCCIKVYAIK